MLAIESTESGTPGRLHVENLLFPVLRSRLNLLKHRGRVCHSDAFCVGKSAIAHNDIYIYIYIYIVWKLFGRSGAHALYFVRRAMFKAA